MANSFGQFRTSPNREFGVLSPHLDYIFFVLDHPVLNVLAAFGVVVVGVVAECIFDINGTLLTPFIELGRIESVLLARSIADEEQRKCQFTLRRGLHVDCTFLNEAR